MSAPSSTERFSDRVADYIRYRPDYPDAALRYLVAEAGWKPGDAIADIGSGTGIFTRHLLEAGFHTFAVEPNGAMREAAEDIYSSTDGFHSVAGTAEETLLGNASVSGIVCAQAFHWFSNTAAKTEFRRILKSDGYVALVWNNRVTDADAFARDYDLLLLQKGNDYANVNHQNLRQEDFAAFFRNGQYRFASFPNGQMLDEAGLIGRAFSSSYVPHPDTDAGQAFATAIRALFAQYAQGGKVLISYATEVYLGQL